jgi:hypothetical protein
VELVGWADPKQRQTRRLQHHLALDAFSMPLSHVATKYGLAWHTVRRAEADAIARWERARPRKELTRVGVDEKWLGRRHKRREKFVTIVSDLDSGEPVWIGYNRDAATLEKWFATLTPEQKAAIVLAACDMHEPFKKAFREHAPLSHVAIVHDPFHVTKRALEAVTELRREYFFRAGSQLRAVGRGTRWLVLRAWERTSNEDKTRLRRLFARNGKLARAYQIVEELREVLKAPDAASMRIATSCCEPRSAPTCHCASSTTRLSLTGTRSSLSVSIGLRPAASKHSTETGKPSCGAAGAIATMTTCSASSASSPPTPSAIATASYASSLSASRLQITRQHDPRPQPERRQTQLGLPTSRRPRARRGVAATALPRISTKSPTSTTSPRR